MTAAQNRHIHRSSWVASTSNIQHPHSRKISFLSLLHTYPLTLTLTHTHPVNPIIKIHKEFLFLPLLPTPYPLAPLPSNPPCPLPPPISHLPFSFYKEVAQYQASQPPALRIISTIDYRSQQKHVLLSKKKPPHPESRKIKSVGHSLIVYGALHVHYRHVQVRTKEYFCLS